jgi:hypothetical protein
MGIRTDGRDESPLRDYGREVSVARTEVIFRDLEGGLVRQIRGADVVVGCIPWLTSKPVLDALARVPGGVGLVVQKEGFLTSEWL